MSKHYEFHTVDVFTDRRFGGNPLAVFPDARGISEGDMQSLAMELNLSETTFVLPPVQPNHSARVRIFNRSHEMPFAGHPMIGTAFVLAQRSKQKPETLTFEVPAGVVAVQVHRDGTTISGATIEAPAVLTIGNEVDVERIAGYASLEASQIVVAAHQPVQVSVGNTYVGAEVSEAALDQAAPDEKAFRLVVDAYPGLQGRFSLYLYTHVKGAIRARMFAPLAGTYEDPATGSAAAPQRRSPHCCSPSGRGKNKTS